MTNFRIIFLFLTLILVVLFGCSKENSDENQVVQENGSIEFPYLIQDKQDLKDYRDKINNDNSNYGDKAYKLIADINFEGEHNWIPIGLNENSAFKGIFDGNGEKVEDIKIGSASTKIEIQYAGLFGYVESAEIKNLEVHWSQINARPNSGGCSGGGIVGYASGSDIVDCNSSGDISIDGSAGGIIGRANNCNILNCSSSNGIITGLTGVGGIVGSGEKSSISFCSSSVEVIGHNNTGGIAGEAEKIENSYATGFISGIQHCGGITGEASEVINCYFTGSVSSNPEINHYGVPHLLGGIAGKSDLIVNCYSTGSIYAITESSSWGAYAGGIVGELTGGAVINSYSSNSVITSRSPKTSYSGGIVAINNGNRGKIINCYSASEIKSRTTSALESKAQSYSCGVIAHISLNGCEIQNCLALNNQIMAICATNSNYAHANRLAGYSVNYYTSAYKNTDISSSSASDKMNVLIGKDDFNLIWVTDFSDTKKHGNELAKNPVDLLNSYVSASSSYNGIPLLEWKVQSEDNNSYPIFDE